MGLADGSRLAVVAIGGRVKRAVLVLSDGETLTLEGRFHLVIEHQREGSVVVETYRNGKVEDDGIVCDDLREAANVLRDTKPRRRRV